MAGSSDGEGRSPRLDRLNQEASVPADSANDFSVRAWLTSAKKCLDQAEDDAKDDDLEAAYVNYVKAVSIIVEVIPRHRGMKDINERKSLQAQEYWVFRKRVSSTWEEVKKLQMKLRALDDLSPSSTQEDSTVGPLNPPLNGVRTTPTALNFSHPIPSQSTGSDKSLRIPRKRPLPLSTPQTAAILNDIPGRPSSASNSEFSSTRISETSTQPPVNTRRFDVQQNVGDRHINHQIVFPKANVIEPKLLLSYLSQPTTSRPPILLLDVRPKEQYERGCIDAEYVVWIDPILLDEEKSGQALEESLVLSPKEQQAWFSTRHQFDLVVIYDEDSRVNSYAGGPVFDRHQVRLRNLTVAIFDFAGYLKPLKHVPMLLVGGIRAWSQLVPGQPLKRVRWSAGSTTRSVTPSPKPVTEQLKQLNPVSDLAPQLGDLDLAAESHWLESLHSDRSPLTISSPDIDSVDKKKINRTMVISPPPPNDPYNKSLLDFFQRFPNVEPESMSGVPQSRSRPTSNEAPRYPTNHVADNSGMSSSNPPQSPQRRTSTFIDHPFHGFTEVKNPEFQPPTPTKKSSDPPFDSRPIMPSPTRTSTHDDEMYPSERSRIPSIGSQISQVGSVSAGMTGLKNLGNTCYMNSVLQCMSATVPLARYFLSGSYRRSINPNNPLGSRGILANAFADLIKHLWGDQYTHISPVSLRSVVGKLQTRFKNSDQQDAQDFLAFFLDGLHEDLNENALKSKLRELTPDEERRRERMPLATISTIEWDRYKHNHKSFLVELFQGQFVSSLKCSVCGTTSTTCNAFMNLSIEISLPHGPQGLKLTQCIDAFVKEEVLEGDDAWNCPTCKRPQRATKQLRIARLPTILIIVLKRFHYAGPWRDKLNTFVDFPMQNLDLTSYALAGKSSNSEKSEKYLYDLYAVTNHFGTLTGDTACVHNNLRGKWYVFDDSRVSPCEDTSVVGRSAYILWYKRNNQF